MLHYTSSFYFLLKQSILPTAVIKEIEAEKAMWPSAILAGSDTVFLCYQISLPF